MWFGLATLMVATPVVAQETFFGNVTRTQGNTVITLRGADVDVKTPEGNLRCKVSQWPVTGGRLQVKCY